MIGSDTNITARKQAEIALQESERRYSSLAAAAPVAIFRFDVQLNCTYVNHRWCEMTGRSAESALGRGWMNALHPDARNHALEELKYLHEHASARERNEVSTDHRKSTWNGLSLYLTSRWKR